jgi:hypothetical protein
MIERHEYTPLPSKEWIVDSEALLEHGVEPGVYGHVEGGEYLTLFIGRDITRGPEGHIISPPKVVYVALFDSPEFGPNAVWQRIVEEFKSGTVEVDGETKLEFSYLRRQP